MNSEKESHNDGQIEEEEANLSLEEDDIPLVNPVNPSTKPDLGDRTRGVSFLGLQTQPGITLLNLLAIPYIQALVTAGVIYCSTRMLFMLRDKDYFSVDNSTIGTVNSELIFNAMVATIPISLVSGYCYDLFGRKLLIIGNSLAMCVLCYLTPLTAPSLWWLQVTFIFVRGTLLFVSCNPLLADYVDKDSLGKASALQNFGSLVGDCFAMGVLMNITASLSHENAFLVTAVISALLVLPMYFLIVEPRKMPKLERKNSDPETLNTEENQP